ncbi:MAG: hydrogenase formation protein HypD [Pseudomonadota bacterium]
MQHNYPFQVSEKILALSDQIHTVATQPWTIMDVCANQTQSIMKYGIQQLLPTYIKLVHGPGCPLSVTPHSSIDEAIAIAQKPHVILCTFPDTLRINGTRSHLLMARFEGADIRTLYSPLDALKIANDNPDKEIVFFSVGYETIAPALGLAIKLASQKPIKNFSVLLTQLLIPAAIEAVLRDNDTQFQGLLTAGHICSVMGYRHFESIAKRYQLPIVISDADPVAILTAILTCIEQCEAQEYKVINQYPPCSNENGNRLAQQAMDEIFEISDQQWRGIGHLPQSAMRINIDFQRFDARKKFDIRVKIYNIKTICRGGDVVKGKCKPTDCCAFANKCTPETPLGPTMISSRGTCAVYYHYQNDDYKPLKLIFSHNK